jgi:hypothetical protein
VMTEQLAELLAKPSASPALTPHLRQLDESLRASGLAGLESLDTEVLASALHELESLVRDWSPVGLADLRSRVAVLARRRIARARAEALASAQSSTAAAGRQEEDLTDLESAHGADISEIGHEAYEETAKSWSASTPSAPPAGDTKP